MRSSAVLFILAAIALGVVPLVAFAMSRGGAVWPDAYVWQVTRFTLAQATLSTVLSVLPAILVARALVRRQFFGRGALLTLLAVPQSLPVIVAIFGLTALFGTAGVFGGWFSLYGLGGIVLAHVFFNLPLATRLLLEALVGAAPENHRLAAQLGFSDRAVFRHVDWPLLQTALPRVAALVFLLCAASFVVVLLLGGPAATTLEVAIYQSLRMDFDVTRALTLSAVQVLLSLLLVAGAARIFTSPSGQAALRMDTRRYDGRGMLSTAIDGVLIGATALLVIPVLFAVLAQGIVNFDVSSTLTRAFATSVAVALLSCGIALPLVWGLGLAHIAYARWRGPLMALGLAGLVVPPAVLATGWFLAFRSMESASLTIGLIATLNALMALPFLLTLVIPAMARNAAQHERLCQQLNVTGWNRFRLVDAPALRGPLAQAAALAFVLSMGDLTAITLLGSQGVLTLPSLVQQQMGHYQSAAAGGTALVLAALCLLASVVALRFSRWT